MHPEDEIVDILAAWREECERGARVEPEDVIRRHPEHADALRARFEALRIAEQALRALEPSGRPAVQPGAAVHLRPLAGDKYTGFDPVGQGGMGIVYWAIDTDLNREVAFKVVRPQCEDEATHVPDDPGAITPPVRDTPASKAFATLRHRFLREATVTGRLEHPGIVPVYEVGETSEGIPYFTMRFIHGRRTLADAIDEVSEESVETRLQLLDPFLKVCDTIHYAHSRGVIHRDLKPENVALGEFGEVVVIDWGLARFRDSTAPPDPRWQEHLRAYRESPDLGTLTGVVGTPGYIAPEALLGEVADERSDVYALGVLLFQILTGQMPHRYASPAEFYAHVSREPAPRPVDLDPDVPPALSDLCTACLDKDGASRPSSAAALVDSIRDWRASREHDREIDGLLREARVSLAAADGLEGTVLLRQLARTSVPLSRVLAQRPEHSDATAMMAQLVSRHAAAVQEETVAKTRRQMRRAGVITLVLVTIAAVVGALVFLEQRHNAEDAREVAHAALDRVRSLALVNASRQVAVRDPLLALMLAREAVRAHAGSTSVSRLHEAILAQRPHVLLKGHEGTIRFAFFSPDGRHVVTSSEDGTARLWDRAGTQLQVYGGGELTVVTVTFSPDSEHILGGCTDGTARIWALDGRELAVLRGHEGTVNVASYSPDGSRVVTPGDDGTVRLWDLNGTEVAILRGHTGAVFWACFSPNGKLILTSAEDSTARLWTLDGKQLAEMPVAHSLMSAKFWLDGQGIVTASDLGDDCYWDLEGKPHGCIPDHWDDLTWIEPSPCGRHLVSASQDGTAYLSDLEGGQDARFRGHDGWVLWATVTPGGAHVLTSGMDGTVRLWDRRGRQLAVLADHEDGLWLGRFSTDGRHVLAAAKGGVVRVFPALTSEVAVLGVHASEVTWGCISPDGRRVLTVTATGSVHLWDLDGEGVLQFESLGIAHDYGGPLSLDGSRILAVDGSGEVHLHELDGREALSLGEEGRSVRQAAFSAGGTRIRTVDQRGRVVFWGLDGQRLLSPEGYELGAGSQIIYENDRSIAWVYDDGSVRLWDRDGRQDVELREHESEVKSVDLLPGSRDVLTATRDGMIRLWDAGGQLSTQFRAHESALQWASLIEDGRRIVTSAKGDATRVWDWKGNELAVFRGDDAWLWRCASMPCDSRLVTRSEDDVTRIWKLDGRELGILRRVKWRSANTDLFGDSIQDEPLLESSSDGRHLLGLCTDGAVRLWDVNGYEVSTLRGHSEETTYACFSPDGRMVLTCSKDRTARVWLVDTHELLELAERRITRDFTPVERSLYGEFLVELAKADEASR